MDNYWRKVSQYALGLAIDCKWASNDPVNLIKLYMPQKLAWIRKELMLKKYANIIHELPIPNKYLFTNIGKLFYDEARNFTLQDIIIEVRSDLFIYFNKE